MAYKVIILYRLYMPSYFLGTFTEYPQKGEAAMQPPLFVSFSCDILVGQFFVNGNVYNQSNNKQTCRTA